MTSPLPRMLSLVTATGLLSCPAIAQVTVFQADFDASPAGAITDISALNAGTATGSWQILNGAGGGMAGGISSGTDKQAAFAHNNATIAGMTQLATVNVAPPTVFPGTKIADGAGSTQAVAVLVADADISSVQGTTVEFDMGTFGTSNTGAFKYSIIRGLDSANQELFEMLVISGSANNTRRVYLRGAGDAGDDTTWNSATDALPEGTQIVGTLPAFTATAVAAGIPPTSMLGVKFILSNDQVHVELDSGNDGTYEIVPVDPFPLNSAALSLRKLEFSTIWSTAVNTQNKGLWLDNVIVTTPGQDTDNDGLPDSWETAGGLNPNSNAGDDGAGGDPDMDGLTNLQEYQRGTLPKKADSDDDTLSDLVETNTGIWVSPSNRGTNPRNADSDGDGLNDAVESNSGTFVSAADPGTSPLKPDTDGDLYQDGYEVNPPAGTAASAPLNPDSPGGPNYPGIGVKFGSGRGLRPGSVTPATAWMGAPAVAQKNWNQTVMHSFTALETNNTASIATPAAGVLVDSTGNATATTIEYTAIQSSSAANFTGTPFDGLYSGLLLNTGAGPSVLANIGGIPYPRFDVYVYAGSDVNGRAATVNGSTSAGAFASYTLASDSAGKTTPVYSSSTAASGNPSAQYVVFEDQTGPDFTAELIRGTANTGIFAIQIVSDPDTDGDGMGDRYEDANGLNKAINDAGGDLDNDGATNFQEFTRGTKPNVADTDGDGVLDGPETNTGIWVSLTDRGTNPFVQDTDGDGLLDGVERNTGIFVSAADTGSSPLDADTDDDLWFDAIEVTNATNPSSNESPGGANPEAIGVVMGSSRGNGPNRLFPATAYAGAASQKNWNQTRLLGAEGTGSIFDIQTPTAGALVNSRGVQVDTSVAFTMNGGWSASQIPGTPYAGLLNAYLDTTTAATPTNFTFFNIPYPTYDVYVYFGADVNGRTGTISSNTTSLTYSYTTAANPNTANGFDTYVETTAATGNPQANYCVFRSQTAADFSVNLNRGSGNAGIFALQVVKSSAVAPFLAWQQQNFGADAGTPSIAGEAADPDKDGIVNLMEYATGSNPNAASPAPLSVDAAGALLSGQFRKATAATDVTVVLEWSPGLQTWSTAGVTQSQISQDATTSLLRATVPAGTDLRKFLRLKVTRP